MDTNGQLSHAQHRGGLFRPLHLVSLLALLLVLIAAGVLVIQFDRDSRIRDVHMAENGFRLNMEESAAAIAPLIDWDDAIQNIDHAFNPQWIEGNISLYVHTQYDVADLFVLDKRDDRTPIYASSRSPGASVQRLAPYAEAVAELVGSVRAAEARRGAFRVPQGRKTLLSQPIHASGLAAASGRFAFVTVSLVQPDFGQALPKGARAPLVVSIEPVNDALLGRFAQRYMLDGLRLAMAAPGSGEAGFRLRDPAGHALGWMIWADKAPGARLMMRLVPPLFFVLAALAVIALVFLRRSEAIASDLIASEARARHLAFHDTLTGLPNRAMMFERVRMALASARRRNASLAVHCLDLDRFKEVNDTLGHPAGDALIRHVAELLTGMCRETDTVARLGGDEFVVVQPDTNASGAALLAERILKAIKEPIELEYGIVEVGISIGTTLISDGDIAPDEALRQADLALYESKDNGRNRVTFFEPEMDAAMRMRRALEADLRKALNERTLQMVYQPQIDHRGNVSGLEALVRWDHPERGMIAPAMFIPLAEESGLILDLGEFVFRRVFEETRSWNKRVAVNVSALQLRSPTFMSMLTQLVAEFRIDATHYEIEITETALLGDDGVTRNNIIMLKQEGFTIALDDFGTGYSSLSTLQKFEVDKIKIDRSFVRNLDADEEADALVDAIIQLGRALKLNIVAEGVETESQRERLASSGCNVFQGYLVSRPVGAEEAAVMAE